MQTVQDAVNNTPTWANWVIIGGSAAASWLAPIASLVAIVWGCLQIYGWLEKRFRKTKTQRRRKGD